MYWSLGRITKVFPGADGKVRVVEVKTKHQERLTRTVSKIVPLPFDEDYVSPPGWSRAEKTKDIGFAACSDGAVRHLERTLSQASPTRPGNQGDAEEHSPSKSTAGHGTMDQCVYVEHCPELSQHQYIRVLDKLARGSNTFQFAKMNGHVLVGLATKALAERLIEEGLVIMGA
ncbi:hypothetical protein LAZ67_3002551 [Cordylochernes scorpioides]|uniref:DUF5641 domain-containing protein n=1 Tax=Cordylochernes scorpioides TaxID=51811 RepID=A0ABY6K9M7_9ARAC|nr:hypothetical protein LAZ67_3002551 [Cordylochernes scorpioides]